MPTISICMIVKNEEAVLVRCLDCFEGLADELIIVDTGSTDRTKEIAAAYTDLVYDFPWQDDFSKARNFSFSKATKDYIYCADADEIIDNENRIRFLQLKRVLLPEVEIVQMKYCNQLEFGTTYNFDEEYRPKLYKRIRQFVWQEPVHESVRLTPVVYESEIAIIHKPLCGHGERDLALFTKLRNRGERISKKLHNMYAKELFIIGKDTDFLEAEPFFRGSMLEKNRSIDEILDAALVAAKSARIRGDIHEFFKAVVKSMALEASSELCFELGEYYLSCNEREEAELWYTNAAYETEPRLNIRYRDELPKNRLTQLQLGEI